MAIQDLLLNRDPPDEDDEEDKKEYRTDKYATFGEMMDDIGFGTLNSKDYGVTLRVPTNQRRLGGMSPDPQGGPAGSPAGIMNIIKVLGDVIGLGEVEKEEFDIGGGGIPIDVTERETQLGSDTDRTLEELGRIVGEDSAMLKRLQYWNRLMGNIGTDLMLNPLIDLAAGREASFTRSGEYESGKLAVPTNLEDMLADHLVAPLVGGLFPGIGAYMAVKVPAKMFLSGAAGMRGMGRLVQALGAAETVTQIGSKPVAAARTAELFADMASGFGLAGFYGMREGLEREGKINIGETLLYGGMGAGIGAVLSGPFQYYGTRRAIHNLDDALGEGVITRQAHIQYIQEHLPPGTVVGERKWDGKNWSWVTEANVDPNRKPLMPGTGGKRKGSFAGAPWKADIVDEGELSELLVRSQLAAVEQAFKDHRITNKPLTHLWRITGGFEKALNDLDLKIKATGGNGIQDVLARTAGLSAQARKAGTPVPAQVERIVGHSPEAAWASSRHAAGYIDSAQRRWETETFENYVEAINTLDAMANDITRPQAERLSAAAEASALKHVARLEGHGPKELQAAGVSIPIETVSVEDGDLVEMASRLAKAPTERELETGWDDIMGLNGFRAELYNSALPNSRRIRAQRMIDLTNEIRRSGELHNLDAGPEQSKAELLRRSASQSRGLSTGMEVLVKNGEGKWVAGEVVQGSRFGNIRVRAGGVTMKVKAVDLVLQAKAGDWVHVRMKDGSFAPAKVQGVVDGEESAVRVVIARADGTMVEADISPRDIETIGRRGGKSEYQANKAVADQIAREFNENIGDAQPAGLKFTRQFEEEGWTLEWRGNQWDLLSATDDPKFIKLYSREWGVEIVLSEKQFSRDYTRGSAKRARANISVDGSGEPPQKMVPVSELDHAPKVVEADPKSNALDEKVGEVPWEETPDWPDDPVTGELARGGETVIPADATDAEAEAIIEQALKASKAKQVKNVLAKMSDADIQERLDEIILDADGKPRAYQSISKEDDAVVYRLKREQERRIDIETAADNEAFAREADWPDSPVTGELEHAAPPPETTGRWPTGSKVSKSLRQQGLKLRRIISGGQTGADTGGLEAAVDLGLETGGTAPYGWSREGGKARTLLEKFGLVEGPNEKHYARNYRARTTKNVEDADLTIVIGNLESPGSKLTRNEVRRLGKQVLVIRTPDLDNPEAVARLRDVILKQNPEVINIAGNRESKNPGIQEKVRKLLNAALGEEAPESPFAREGLGTPTQDALETAEARLTTTRPYGKFAKGQRPAKAGSHIAYITVPHAAAKKIMAAWKAGKNEAMWDSLVNASHQGGKKAWKGQIYADRPTEGYVTLALELGKGATDSRVKQPGFGPTLKFIKGGKATLKELRTATATYDKPTTLDNISGIWHVEDDLLAGGMGAPFIKDILDVGDPVQIEALRAMLKREINASNPLPPGYQEASARVTKNVAQESTSRAKAAVTKSVRRAKTHEVRDNLELLLGLGDRPLTTPDAIDRDALAAARGMIDMLATWRNWPILDRIPGGRRYGNAHPFVQATAQMAKIQAAVDVEFPRPREIDFRNPTTGELDERGFNTAAAEWSRQIKRAYRDAGAHNPVLQALREAGVSDVGEEAVTIKVPHRTIPGESLTIQVVYPDMKNPARVQAVRAMQKSTDLRGTGVEQAVPGGPASLPGIDEVLEGVPLEARGGFSPGGESVAILGGHPESFAGVSDEEIKQVIWKAIKLSGLQVGNVRTRTVKGARMRGGADKTAYNIADNIEGITSATHDAGPARRIISTSPDEIAEGAIDQKEIVGSLDNIIKPEGRGAILDGTKRATVRTEKMKIFKGDGWYEIDGKPVYVKYHGKMGHSAKLQQAAFGDEPPRFGAQKKWAEGDGELHTYSFSQEGPEVQQKSTQRYFDTIHSRAQDGDEEALIELARMIKTGKSGVLREVREAAETVEQLSQRGLQLDAQGQPAYSTTREGYVLPEAHERNVEAVLDRTTGIYTEEATAARIAETGEPFPTGMVDEQVSGYDPVSMEAAAEDLQAAIELIRTNKKRILNAAEKDPVPADFELKQGGRVFKKQIQSLRDIRSEVEGPAMYAPAGAKGQNEFADRLTMAGMDAIEGADAVIYIAKPNVKDSQWGLARAVRLAEQKGKPVVVVYRTGNGTDAYPFQWQVHSYQKGGMSSEFPQTAPGRRQGLQDTPRRAPDPPAWLREQSFGIEGGGPELVRNPQVIVSMPGVSDGVNLGAQRQIPNVALKDIVARSQWARMQRETVRALQEGKIPPIWAYYKEWLAGVNNEAYDINSVITRETHPWHYFENKRTGELVNRRYGSSKSTKDRLVKREALREMEDNLANAKAESKEIVGDQHSKLEASSDLDRILDNEEMTSLMMESELIDDLARGMVTEEGIPFYQARKLIVEKEVARLEHLRKTDNPQFQERLNQLDRVGARQGDYTIPEPIHPLETQALELGAILHNFDMSKGNRLGVGEYIHSDNGSVYGWVQRMADSKPYWVSLRHAALPGNRSQVIDQVHKFETRREAVQFLHDSGFERNRNNLVFTNDDVLRDLPNPLEIEKPADIINLNAELASAIQESRTKYGYVPAALVDYANDFIDRGWARFFSVDHPSLLWEDGNLKAIGRTRRMGKAPQMTSAVRGQSAAYGLIDNEIVQLIPEHELARLENPAMGSHRELSNLSAADRQATWEGLGMDQYDQQQYLAYSYTDMRSPVGSADPKFQQSSTIDWIASPDIFYEENGRVKMGKLQRAFSEPGNEYIEVSYFDTELDEFGRPGGWKSKTLEKGETYMSLRPGDEWDPRKIAGMMDRNQGMRIHRSDGMGTGAFDQEWGLTGIADKTEYKRGLYSALKRIIGANDEKNSSFIIRKGDDLMFSMSGATPEEVDQLVDWYIRFSETQGRLFETRDLSNVLNDLKKEMGFTGNVRRQADLIETLQVKGLDRARAMIGDPDEPIVDLLAKARVGLLPKRIIGALRKSAKERFGLKNVDSMTDLDVMEYMAPRMDRNLAASIPEMQQAMTLDHLASMVKGQKGAMIGLHEYREAGGKVLELVTRHMPSPGSIMHDGWFRLTGGYATFPRTVGEKNPTFNFFYNKISQVRVAKQTAARDLHDRITKYWGIYDPTGKYLNEFRSVLKAGYRDWDDFVLNGNKEDVARLSNLMLTAKGEFDGDAPTRSFELFFDSLYKQFEAARYDLIETQFAAGDAPVIKITSDNWFDEEVQLALGEYERQGGIVSDIGEMVLGGPNIENPKPFYLTMPRDHANFRSEAEVEFFMHNLMRGTEEFDRIPEGLREQLRARGWEYMENEWGYYKDWGADMNWPVVNSGRFRIMIKEANEKPRFFGMSSSEKDAHRTLTRLRRQGDETLRDLVDADKAGEDVWVSVEPPDWTIVDAEDYSIMSPEVYRGFMRAMEKEGTTRMELMTQLRKIGIEGQQARHTPYERPNGVRLAPDKGWTDNPYDELQTYLNRILTAKYTNQIYRAAETAKQLDPMLSKAYGVNPIFSEEVAAIAAGSIDGKLPTGAKKIARKNRYYKYMEDLTRYLTGERTSGEKRIDNVLQFWNWMETKGRFIPNAIGDAVKSSGEGDPVMDLNKIYRITMSKDGGAGPFNSVYHRKYASKNLSQGIMHGQAVMRLGFSPASAMVNGMQWMVNTMPILGVDNTKAGIKDALYFFASNDSALAKGEVERLWLQYGPDWIDLVAQGKIEHKIPKEWMDIHNLLRESGVELVTGRAQAEELLGITLGADPTKSPLWHPHNKSKALWDRYEYYSLMMFNGAERVNRATTAIAAGRAATRKGLKGDARIAFVQQMVEKTQFTYADIGLPPIMRASHLRALTQFKPFMFNQLKFEIDLVKRAAFGPLHGDWSGWGPLSKHYAVLGTLGGVAGLAYSPMLYGVGAAYNMIPGQNKITGESGLPFNAGSGDFMTNVLFKLPLIGDAIKEQGHKTEWGRLDNPWFQGKNVAMYGLFGAFDADVSRRLSVTGPELMVSRLGDFSSMVLGPHFSMYVDLALALHADKTKEHIGSTAEYLALMAGALSMPYLKGWGGLVAAMGTAQGASMLTSGGADKRALISPSFITHEAQTLINPLLESVGVGSSRDTRDPAPGALFMSMEGQRFARNFTPTVIRNQLMTAEIMAYGEVHDLGGNLDRIGPASWSRSGPRSSEILRESVLRWLGISSVRSGKNRIYTQVVRNETEAFERKRERYTRLIADAYYRGDDYAELMYLARKDGVTIDQTMLINKILRMTTPAIQMQLEQRYPDLR